MPPHAKCIPSPIICSFHAAACKEVHSLACKTAYWRMHPSMIHECVQKYALSMQLRAYICMRLHANCTSDMCIRLVCMIAYICMNASCATMHGMAFSRMRAARLACAYALHARQACIGVHACRASYAKACKHDGCGAHRRGFMRLHHSGSSRSAHEQMHRLHPHHKCAPPTVIISDAPLFCVCYATPAQGPAGASVYQSRHCAAVAADSVRHPDVREGCGAVLFERVHATTGPAQPAIPGAPLQEQVRRRAVLCVAAGAAHPPPAVVLRRGRHAEDGDDFDVSLVVLVGETPVRAAQLPEAVSAYLDPLLALDGPAMPGALVQRPAPMCCTTTVTRVIGAGAGDEGSSDLPWFQLTIVLEFIPALGEGGALGLAEVLPAVGLASTLVRDCGWDPADLHGLRRVRMVDGSFATTTASMGPVWRSTLRMPSTVGAAPPPGMPLSSPPMRPSCALLEGDTDGGSDADTDDDDGETPSTVYDSDATIPWTASL